MIIAISDVHIGARNGNAEVFAAFLNDVSARKDADDITDLVLCGDILDFWRCDVMDMMFESADVMFRLKMLADEGIFVHYIAGNHDYIMRNAVSKHKHMQFLTDLRITDDDITWSFLHGWEFDTSMNPAYFDAFCYANTTKGDHIHETFGTYLGFLPPVKAEHERLSGDRIQSDMQNMFPFIDKPALRNTSPNRTPLIDTAQFHDGGTVFGHTHIPQLNAERGLVDCGSWDRGYPTHNTYAEINDGVVWLKQYG